MLKKKEARKQDRLNQLEAAGKNIELMNRDENHNIYNMNDKEFDIYLQNTKQETIQREKEVERKNEERKNRISRFREFVSEEEKEPFKKVLSVAPELFKNADFFKLPDSINLKVLEKNPDAFLIHGSRYTDSIVLCHNRTCMLFSNVYNRDGYKYNSNYEDSITSSKIKEKEEILRRMIYDKNLKRSPKVIQEREDRISKFEDKLKDLKDKNDEFYSMERGFGQTYALIVVSFENYFGKTRNEIGIDTFRSDKKYNDKYIFLDSRIWSKTIEEMKEAKNLNKFTYIVVD